MKDCESYDFISTKTKLFVFNKEVSVNKQELIEVVANKTGQSKRACGDVINTVIDEVTGSLKKGQKIVLAGFGTFTTTKRASRVGVNPQKPEEKIQIAASIVPRFRAGKTLKLAVKK